MALSMPEFSFKNTILFLIGEYSEYLHDWDSDTQSHQISFFISIYLCLAKSGFNLNSEQIYFV